MSRFFRASRMIGRCYKPAICMISAASLYSFPSLATVSAATTLNHPKPSLVDIIAPGDKTIDKETDGSKKKKKKKKNDKTPFEIILPEPFQKIQKIIEIYKADDVPTRQKAFYIGIVAIPLVIQGCQYGLKPAMQLMEKASIMLDNLLGESISSIGEENVSTLLALCAEHRDLVSDGCDTVHVVLEECKHQKANLETLLSLLEIYDVMNPSQENLWDDCISDLQEWVKQQALVGFWKKCNAFQIQIEMFKKEIDEMKDGPTKNKILKVLTYVAAGSVVVTGTVLETTGALDDIVGEDYSKYISRSMIVAGGATLAGTYYFTDSTLSLKVLNRMRLVSNELSLMINDCKILQGHASGSNRNAKSAGKSYEKSTNRRSSEKRKSDLLRAIQRLDKYEEEVQKMIESINKIRQR